MSFIEFIQYYLPTLLALIKLTSYLLVLTCALKVLVFLYECIFRKLETNEETSNNDLLLKEKNKLGKGFLATESSSSSCEGYSTRSRNSKNTKKAQQNAETQVKNRKKRDPPESDLKAEVVLSELEEVLGNLPE